MSTKIGRSLTPTQIAQLAQLPTGNNNLVATVAPTVNDDDTAGYSVGSTWIDTVADKAYILVDATTGSAVWIKITQSGGAYTEKFGSTVSISTINTWQVRTLPGATSNTKVDVLMEKSGSHVGGVRAVGSSLARHTTFRESFTMTVVTDGSGQIEIKSDDITTTFRLLGEHI